MHVADSHGLIRVRGARENNLKDVSVELPKRRLTVFTGVSGSGKSSLVFDTSAAESQRMTNETYSAIVQGFMPTLARPDVDVLDGLTTAILVDQERMGANARSTVGTVTDANALLRILFSRLGQLHIGSPQAFSFNIRPRSRSTASTSPTRDWSQSEEVVPRAFVERAVAFAPCPECGGTRLNAPARSSKIDGVSIADACAMRISDLADWVRALDEPSVAPLLVSLQQVLTGVAGSGKSSLIRGSVTGRDGVVSVDQAAIRGSRRSNPATYTGLLDPIRKAFAKANGVKPALFSANSEGACPNCNGAGVIYTDLGPMASVATTCGVCEGRRFDASVLDCHLGGRDISEVLAMPVTEAEEFFATGEPRIPAAHAILPAARRRGPRICLAGAAADHALRRGAATPEARDAPGRGRRDLRPRRADHRPPSRRRRAAARPARQTPERKEFSCVCTWREKSGEREPAPSPERRRHWCSWASQHPPPTSHPPGSRASHQRFCPMSQSRSGRPSIASDTASAWSSESEAT
ncbi:hypothetical protein GCM10023152_19390 [Agromyces bauzanensis]|uniref:UvrABC system protein A n=1 Tax=Agromyces bauzanensis TaxID=1308924 RepID=A0A917PGM5_9MICO|nr:hypothetical protein GCM10011372_14450 [Agromyces bauzanensis]